MGELERLAQTIAKTNQIIMSFADQLSKLTIKIEAVENKLDYRKQAQEERFVPPSEPAMPGIKPNVGED